MSKKRVDYMVKYKKIYFNHFSLGPDDFCYCEVCLHERREVRMNWVHHIKAKGMGGSKEKDHIENLMGICYDCDHKYGDRVQYMDYLIEIHKEFMKNNPY